MIIKTIADQGQRPYMEDRFKISSKDGVALVVVADGHGGHSVAEHLISTEAQIEMTSSKLLEALSTPEYSRRIYEMYTEMDRKICDSAISPTVGSTLLTVFITPREIIAGNCGDTMAMVGKLGGSSVARWLSREHKASSEIPAIEARGGQVYAPDGFMMRVNGMLNMSRSMGDAYLKKYITASPYVAKCRKQDYDYVFCATDGVWDVMTLEDVHRVISFSKCPDTALRALLDISRQRHSGDNIAMVLILFSTEKKKILL